jgi:uncharacterized protein YndB with AHSA1/START domain
MPTKSTEYSMVDVLEEMATLLAGVGTVTLAIFPLALPMIALTAGVAIPLALVGLVAGPCSPPCSRRRSSWSGATTSRDEQPRATVARGAIRKDIQMSERLTIEARAHTSADPQTVWALLEDVNRYKDWGPWSESGYVEQPVASPHGPGAVRRLRCHNRRGVTIEPVVEVQPGRRLVYDVTSGVPVRNYRATVELTPDRDGTQVDWRATFDGTVRGRLVRGILQRVYGEVVNRLVAAAEAAPRHTPGPAPSG